MKTEKEINKKIKELVKDTDNFAYQDYGCDGMSDECCGNCGGRMFDDTKTENTLTEFAKWLLDNQPT